MRWLVAVGMCWAVTAAPSAAAPPPSAPPSARAAPAAHLDLRLPSERSFMPASAWGTAGVPTGRAAPVSGEKFEAQERWGRLANGPAAQPTAQTAALVQRFRREGVPLARLWENHAALLSLGLNQRGKPGIWLVQKIH